jgi:hypothetical protein
MPSPTTDRAFFPVSELIDESGWPVPDLVPDSFEHLWISSPDAEPDSPTQRFGLLLDEELSLRVPGVDALTITLAPAPGGSAFDIAFSADPFGVVLEEAEIVLRVDAGVLRPLKPGSDEPDMEAETLDIELGSVSIGIDAEGAVGFELGAASVPRCMVGSSGVIVSAGEIAWVKRGEEVPGAPPAFTGLRLDDVEIGVPGLPQLGELRMDDVFLGSGGFTGRVEDQFDLGWDGSDFTGDLHGELLGFRGGLGGVAIEFRQSALVACSIAGDVAIPFLDLRLGLEIGLSGDGGVSAAATLPHTGDPGVSVGPGDHLLHLDVLGLLAIDLDAIRFEAPAGGPAAVELSGSAKLDVAGLEMPPVDVAALRITADGDVDIEGGWLDLPSGRIAPFHGFPLELSRIGFGSEGTGAARRNWIGLNGALKLADGLPVGSSVEGLRVSWDAAAPSDTVADTVSVSLDGVGLELVVPGAVEFSGAVSFANDDGAPTFRGHGQLALPAVGVDVDADVVVGRTAAGDSFYFFHLATALPAGIPLFSTGTAFFGFEGLVAESMAPDRGTEEPWYHGWYKRAPVGATGPRKWAYREGAFAIGIGTTIGTFPDSGFAFHTDALLIVVLPGPVLMLEGKGGFLTPRSGGGEGAFEALLVLDVPDKRFEANLAATYEVPLLLALSGSVDVAASWRSPQPPHVWHVYLGEDEPLERRWRAQLLSIFEASSYLMVERTGLRLGAWIGFDEDWRFGPVRVWARAEIDGSGEVAWKPTHFHGHLHLGGEVGVSAFGAKIVIAASADVDAQGPTPWTVELALRASISIDLWLFSFSWSTTLHLEWGDRDHPRPDPALPVVESVSHEHLLATESGPLSGATIPADGRQLVVFSRPVRDLARIGAPASPTLPPEPVSPEGPVARYSYQLGHVALVRRTGGDRVLAASGIATVTDAGTVTLSGLGSLPGVDGGSIAFDGGDPHPVGGWGAGGLQVGGAPAAGTYPYRLSGSNPAAEVVVESWSSLGAGLARAELSADPGIVANALGGGTLTAADGGEHLIVGNRLATVTVRAPEEQLPATGAAWLVGPGGPTLEGVWLPDDADPAANPTKLLLGARTPFALFRHNEEGGAPFAKRNPDYPCGPEAGEEALCFDFGALPPGPLSGGFEVGRLPGEASGEVEVVADGERRQLRLGGGGLKSRGAVVFSFSPPVEMVEVRCRTEEGGRVVAHRAGTELARERVPAGGYDVVSIRGEIDTVVVSGSRTYVAGICFLPGWSCINFRRKGFQQDSTGRRSHHGLELVTAGRMRVDDGVLSVAAPRRRLAGLAGLGPIELPRLPAAPRSVRLAVLTIELPRPVTRACVRLRAPASVSAYTSLTRVAAVDADADAELLLRSADRVFDRLVLVAVGRVALDRVCLESGDLGARRLEQWAWRDSVRHSIESFYAESPVLPPGRYQLRVVTGWADETGGAPEPTSWTTDRYDFSVGPPPGLGAGEGDVYPAGGPLNDLGTYVERTLPAPGERPFYRSHDVAVAFSEDYVSRIFAAAGSPLSLAVLDANGREVRPDGPNVWGRDPELALSREEQDWVATLHGDGGEQCATLDTERVSRNEEVRAGAGELLAPEALHHGELRAARRPLHGFDFVTSRFASFAQHLASFDGACRPLPATGTAPAAALAAQVEGARSRLRDAIQTLELRANAAESGNPTAAQLQQWRLAREAIAPAREELRNAHQAAHLAAAEALGLPAGRPPVEGVRVSQAANALLIESAEPILWERIDLALRRQKAIPLRRREIGFDRDGFGAPDAGEFRYAGFDWTSSAELWVRDGALAPRVEVPFTLDLRCPHARSVTALVRLSAGGSVTLSAAGSPDSVAVAPADEAVEKAVSLYGGVPLGSVRLAFDGAAIVSLSVGEGFQPEPPRGPARIAAVRLPGSAADTSHRVDLVAFADTDLGGWQLRWLDALAPAAEATSYHRFAPGLRLGDGGAARVYGGRGVADPEDGFEVMAGGLVGTLPATGAVLRLVDPAGRVADEFAAMPPAGAAAVTDHLLLPNGDGTAALLVAPEAALASGHWTLRLSFKRYAGRWLPRLSVGGSADPEVAALSFTVE